MSDAEPPATLPPAAIEAILAATGRSRPLTAQQIDDLRDWLGKALKRAIGRARQLPLTPHDVAKVERAYLRFRDTLEKFQDRDEPPPLIPIRDGTNDWEHWIRGVTAFGFKRGRRAKTDWRLIADLIAFYEIISGRVASAARDGGPTMRSLRAALAELSAQAPPELRSKSDAPIVDALKQQLSTLRQFDVPIAVEQLKRLSGEPG